MMGMFALLARGVGEVKNMAAENVLAKNVYAAFTSVMQRK